MKRVLLACVFSLGITFSALADMDSAIKSYDQGDYITAFREFHVLANKGIASAQNNLAVMYANGQGVKPDAALAAKWYMAAAEQGLAVAQFNIGTLFEKGEGVEHDAYTAIVWYSMAAIQGDNLAQYHLGRIYSQLDSDHADPSQAYFWLTLAAKNSKDKELQEKAGKLMSSVVSKLSAKEKEEISMMVKVWKPS